MNEGQETLGGIGENFNEFPQGRTADLAAKKAGFGNENTYRQAKAVVEKAEPELVDASMMEFSGDYAPLSPVQEPKWRVKSVLSKLNSDRANKTNYFIPKFGDKIEEIFSGLPKPKDARKFLENDLVLLFTPAEVQEFALKHRVTWKLPGKSGSLANALLEIRDSRLYRRQFPTFEAYCRERWGLKQSRAYQLLDAAVVVGNLQSSTIVELPKTESQARPLTRLEPEVQREVWQDVVASTPADQITARVVEEKAKSAEPPFGPRARGSTFGTNWFHSTNRVRPTRAWEHLRFWRRLSNPAASRAFDFPSIGGGKFATPDFLSPPPSAILSLACLS